MSRGKLHCIVAVVAVAGFFAVAPPRAEAAGGAPSGPDFWSVALRWVESWWEGVVVEVWNTKGGIEPNGSDSTGGPSPSQPGGESNGDQGWMIDPNG